MACAVKGGGARGVDIEWASGLGMEWGRVKWCEHRIGRRKWRGHGIEAPVAMVGGGEGRGRCTNPPVSGK